MRSFCSAKASLIFSTKNFSVFGYWVLKHLMSWPLNELVKLTMLWTTGPWWTATTCAWGEWVHIHFSCHFCKGEKISSLLEWSFMWWARGWQVSYPVLWQVLLWLSIRFPVQCSPSEMGSTLKGKNLLLWEQIIFFRSWRPLWRSTKLAENSRVSPLNVYPFTLNLKE